MITFQDKIEMFQGLRRYDPVTGEAVPVLGHQLTESVQSGQVVEDPSVENPFTTENPVDAE